MILGETCQWWDVSPYTADGGQVECRTADGIALQILYIRRSDAKTSTAVRLARRPVRLSEILPGPGIASPTAWGLADTVVR